MTNIQQYTNRKNPCYQLKLFSNPSIDTSNMLVPKKTSEYLLYDNFLSEYNTELEKNLIMLNILLFDNVPKENSTRLVNSGIVYKVMREGKLERDQLTKLFNYLQKTKVDKSELFSKDYLDLINKPNNLSDFDNDLNFVSLEELNDLLENLENLINSIKNSIILELWLLIRTQEYINEITNLIEIPLPISNYNDLTNKPYIPKKVSDLTNDAGYINQHLSLDNYYTKLQLNQILNNKFIILSENEYEQLTEYIQDAIYLVLEDGESVNHTGWKLGDGLPIILSGEWKFGDNLPIILS